MITVKKDKMSELTFVGFKENKKYWYSRNVRVDKETRAVSFSMHYNANESAITITKNSIIDAIYDLVKNDMVEKEIANRCEFCENVKEVIKHPNFVGKRIKNCDGYSIDIDFLHTVSNSKGNIEYDVVLLEIKDKTNYFDEQHLLKACPYCNKLFSKLKEEL